MNKKLKQILSVLIIIFLSITYFSITNVSAQSIQEEKNSATGYSIVIEDDAELLSSEEINQLKEKMQPLTKYGNIIFKSISENNSTTEHYAAEYYHNKFGTNSGTLFLIDMDNRYIYIFSDGANYQIVTADKAEIITDNVYSYASDADYYQCASVAFSQINTILSGGKIAEPMRHISNILIAITVAFFINFIVVLITSSAKKASDEEVLKNVSINFNVSDIKVTQIGTHRKYSPVSSSSSGSSSGGGGGGGSSSGGGGGHSF